MADMYNDSKHTAIGLTSDLSALEGESEKPVYLKYYIIIHSHVHEFQFIYNII